VHKMQRALLVRSIAPKFRAALRVRRGDTVCWTQTARQSAPGAPQASRARSQLPRPARRARLAATRGRDSRTAHRVKLARMRLAPRRGTAMTARPAPTRPMRGQRSARRRTWATGPPGRARSRTRAAVILVVRAATPPAARAPSLPATPAAWASPPAWGQMGRR